MMMMTEIPVGRGEDDEELQYYLKVNKNKHVDLKYVEWAPLL